MAGGVESEAVYSDCERYRYALTRTWEPAKPRLLYIMLNPSKATEVANDPTIERCQRRAVALGYGAFRATNLFAWRETSPERLKKRRASEGRDNMATLCEAANWADTILCAWGVHGTHRDQGARVLAALDGHPLHNLGLTKQGHPRHPLYVGYSVQPLPWSP